MFKTWLINEGKYHTYGSMICGHCDGTLMALRIKPNYKHIYTFGQMFLCTCKKSRVWTNSIRDEDELLSCFTDQSKRYRRGFCNDSFCGYCQRYVQPLENGYQYKGESTDRWGCEKCKDNQKIIVFGYKKDEEGDQGTANLFNWYKRNKDYLQATMDAEKLTNDLDKMVFWRNYHDRKK